MTARTRAWMACAVTLGTLLIQTAPASASIVFADGFENAATVQDLLSPGRWSYVQLENPESTVELSTGPVHSGTQSLRYFGHPSYRYSTITKADIAWTRGRFGLGKTIEVESWFYLSDGAELSDLYLIDAECTICGTQSPGTRIRLENGYPEIERSKILELPSIAQTKVAISTQRWFDIRYRFKIGIGPLGHMWLWVDGTKVIDQPGTTVFPGGFVDSVQVGLTANASRSDAEMFADDVTIRRMA
jgi:hypothetical protein